MSNTRKATGTPASTSAMFDLDAVEAEAEFEPFPFKLGGRTFILPHLRMLDRRVVASADEGDFAAMDAAFREGLGDDYEAFIALPLSLHALDKLFRAWLEHSGLAPGELPASLRS